MAIPAGGRVVVRSEEEAREGREGGEAGTFLSRARNRGELDDDAKRAVFSVMSAQECICTIQRSCSVGVFFRCLQRRMRDDEGGEEGECVGDRALTED